jgi:hypothetical protein
MPPAAQTPAQAAPADLPAAQKLSEGDEASMKFKAGPNVPVQRRRKVSAGTEG